MARPLKDGIDYFPFDVVFLQDKKIRLIKGEFGAKGVMVVLQLLCSIYKENGYFITCDDDDCLLMAEAVGCGVESGFIRQVVDGCIRRSLFDNKLFNMFGILTSRGIQRRYLRALSTRGNIYIYKEYWLLDMSDKKDVPASISKKITFNHVSLQKNDVKSQNNPTKKNRVNESKRKENKSGIIASSLFQMLEHYGFQVDRQSRETLMAFVDTYSEEWVKEAIKRSADRGKKTLGYVKGILSNWQIAGVMDDGKPQAKARQQLSAYVQEPNVPKKYIPSAAKKETSGMPEELRQKLSKMF